MIKTKRIYACNRAFYKSGRIADQTIIGAYYYVRSSVLPDGTKDGILKQVCVGTGATFADISPLSADPKNYE